MAHQLYKFSPTSLQLWLYLFSFDRKESSMLIILWTRPHSSGSSEDRLEAREALAIRDTQSGSPGLKAGIRLYNAQCTVYTVHCTLFSVQCPVSSVQCTMYSVQCTIQLFSTICTILHFLAQLIYMQHNPVLQHYPALQRYPALLSSNCTT